MTDVTDKAFGGEMVQLLLALITALGAMNWAASEFLETDVLIDLAGLGGSELQIAYGVIAAAAVVMLYNELVYKGFIEG